MAEALRQGRFVCLGALGEGTQGTTFDGVDKREGRPVAIKRFDVRGAKAWKDVELAEREARVLSSLSHPRLPAYVDHFEEDGALYLVMEKIEGESLLAMRKRGAVLSEDDILRLLRDASEVLDYLHGRAPPVIHRDLKPGNVIRRPDKTYAFVDFGAVRDKLKPQGGSTVVGTFGYMAPEQFQGRATPASDVYAIGATALAMLTGEEPENLPHKGLGIDVEAALEGRASRRLVETLSQMLAPDPDTRPSRIAPLLERFARRDRDREEPSRDKDERSRRIERELRKSVRKAEKWQRRTERSRARDERRSRRGVRVPWPIQLAVTLALALASVGVALALRVVVPTVLFLLSIVFGRGMRDAARRVSDAGRRASDAMHRARLTVEKGLAPPRQEELDAEEHREPAQVRVRPVDEGAPKLRVDDDHERSQAEIEAEEEADRAKRKK